MKLISDTLCFPALQYASRATCIEGYDYPPDYQKQLVAAQDVHALCLEDILVFGDGYTVDAQSGAPVFEYEGMPFFPRYVGILQAKGCRGDGKKLTPELTITNKTAITVDAVITVLHLNQGIYGHFLLEIATKVFVLKELFKKAGNTDLPPIALSSKISKWVKHYIMEIWPECNILWFDHNKEYIAAKNTFIVTGQWIQRQPEIANFFLEFAKEKSPVVQKKTLLSKIMPPFLGTNKKYDPDKTNRKVLLTRPSRHFSKRNIVNFSALTQIAAKNGYEIIEPKSFGSLKEQALFFNQCSVVLGEFTSALHNTIFSPPGTIIGCLNYRSGYQESISSAIGHNLNYLLPDSGPIVKDNEQAYTISEQKFAQLIIDIEKQLSV